MRSMIEEQNGRDVLRKKPDGFDYAARYSVSISAEHHQLLDRLKDKSGYSKTQLVCMALDYFVEHVTIEGDSRP